MTLKVPNMYGLGLAGQLSKSFLQWQFAGLTDQSIMSLTPEQEKECKEAFDLFDGDGSGDQPTLNIIGTYTHNPGAHSPASHNIREPD